VRQQRQRPGFAREVAQDHVDEPGLDRQPGNLGRRLDGASKLVLVHWPQQDVRVRERTREARDRRTVSVEVGPQCADGYDGAVAFLDCVEQHVDEAGALGRVAADGEQLLHLVDCDDNPRGARSRGLLELGRQGRRRILAGRDDDDGPRRAAGHLSASNRGEEAGAHEGRLPAARCTHDDDEAPVEQPSEEIGGLRLTTKEDVVILGLVRKQSLVRAQTADRFPDRARRIDDRADALGSGQTSQFLLAELGQRNALGEMVDDDLGDGLGNEDLSTGREATNPGGPVDRRAVVVAVTTFDLTDVDRETHREPAAGRPIPGFESVTSRDRRAHGLGRA
jgi:hypothetical protein